ncbi:MAG TPA: hypothetical protein VFV38_07495 [Ktedonobacteraceae bacterium]|nr:hypothetical protein [Ktedonobacteraceae bacterium]
MQRVLVDIVSPSVLHQERIAWTQQSARIDALYFCACHLIQMLDDYALMLKLASGNELQSHTLQAERARLQDICKTLALQWTAHATSTDEHAQTALTTLARQLSSLTISATRAACMPPAYYILQQHLSHWQVPECSGYDLCDVEVCAADARHWLQDVAQTDQPPLLIGIRTGGVYYAPFWAAHCQQHYGQNVSFHTLRPFHGPQDELLYLAEELATLPASIASERPIILIDDQPDSGQTVLALARQLEEHYQRALCIRVAAPGRYFLRQDTSLHASRDTLPLATQRPRRVWQSLDPAHERDLLARLAEQGVPLTRPYSHLRIKPMIQPFASRYQNDHLWQPWSHPDLQQHQPRRINPRKSPFVIEDVVTQQPLWHGKFIGQDVFGEHEFHVLQNFASLQPQPAYYVDGYVITAYEHGLHAFKDVYHASSEARQQTLCRDACGYWNILQHTRKIPGPLTGYAQPLRAAFQHSLQRLSPLLPDRALIAPEWIAKHVPEMQPETRGHEIYVHSALPYSHFFWHWQVQDSDGSYKLRRFHNDANWGGTGRLSLEVASFLLENHIVPRHARLICQNIEQVQDEAAFFASVLDQLPAALLLALRAYGRRRRFLSTAGIEQMRADILALVAYFDIVLLTR